MISSNTRAKVIALLSIGICEAIKIDTLTIDDAERLLFSPFLINKLRNSSLQLADLIHMGTELEDIKKLVPNEFDATLERIRKAARETLSMLPRENPQEDHWIHVLFD